MKGFGKILVQLRGEKTQEQVADDLGVATSTIAMYETEKRIPRDTMKVKLAEYYGVTVMDIFFTSNVTKCDKA